MSCVGEGTGQGDSVALSLPVPVLVPVQFGRTDRRRSSVELTPDLINSLLTDSKQQWQRRRESVAHIRMQSKMGIANGNNALPWREVKDATQAIRVAATFLSLAVEQVPGQDRGAFRGTASGLVTSYASGRAGVAVSHALPVCVCGCLWLWSVPAPVKTPPRADDPRPSLAQIMDATNFLSDKRLMQIDRKDGYTTGVELCKFEHVHGSTVCSSLFEHRVEPDGRVVHYYMTDKMNELVGQCDGGFVVVVCPSGVDIAVVRCRHDLQIRDDELHAPEAPLSIADVCSAHCIPLPPLPPAAVRPTILSPFHPTPVASVKPVGHLLPCATHTCHGNSAEACDHFGVFPDVPMQLNGVVDAEMLRAEEEAEKSGFTIDGSVFWPRLFTSESQCKWGCKLFVRFYCRGGERVRCM